MFYAFSIMHYLLPYPPRSDTHRKPYLRRRQIALGHGELLGSLRNYARLRTCRAELLNLSQEKLGISNTLPRLRCNAHAFEGFGARLLLHGHSTNHCLPCNPSFLRARPLACCWANVPSTRAHFTNNRQLRVPFF